MGGRKYSNIQKSFININIQKESSANYNLDIYMKNNKEDQIISRANSATNNARNATEKKKHTKNQIGYLRRDGRPGQRGCFQGRPRQKFGVQEEVMI